MLSEAVLIALIAALPALLGALWQGWKTRADVHAMRATISRAAARVDDANAELRPNSGATVRDAIDRIEAQLEMLSAEHRSLRDDLAFERREASRRTRAQWKALEELREYHRGS